MTYERRLAMGKQKAGTIRERRNRMELPFLFKGRAASAKVSAANFVEGNSAIYRHAL